ncbi:MAG: hypothetical protein U0996_10735 [Planctomycetaceae bacterium]
MSIAELNAGQDERWLACQLDKGMFSDEVAVSYPPSGNLQTSVFVGVHTVRGTTGHRGKVRVRVIRRNGSLLAILPSANQDIVSVSEQDVSEE